MEARAALDLPPYFYYVIGFLIVSNLGTLGAFAGTIIKYIIDYNVQKKQVELLTQKTSQIEGHLSIIQKDLDALHSKVRAFEKA